MGRFSCWSAVLVLASGAASVTCGEELEEVEEQVPLCRADPFACGTYYVDLDGDGFGDPNRSRLLPGPEAPYIRNIGGDCDDTNPAIHPNAPESCNGVDDNCDGVIDGVDAIGCFAFYADVDRDGFGDPNNSRCACGPSPLYAVTNGGDCNDNDPSVHRGAAEVCNGEDTDCDGLVDEGFNPADPSCQR